MKQPSGTTSTQEGRELANEDHLDDPFHSAEIVADSQQSRFHRETFDANSTDIDIKGVNISINSKDLLVDAHLRLKSGARYGMVGQNGVGKSVMMSVLANNILVGLPQNIRILHIAQLEDIKLGSTILEEVLRSDKQRNILIDEARALQGASSGETSHVVHRLLLSRKRQHLDAVRKTATKLSGARGWNARLELNAVEQEYEELASQDPLAYITPKMINDMTSEVLEKYALLDVEGDVAKAKKILRGLGFPDEDIQRPIVQYSGGWRMRVMLSKALFVEPDILLLDEPTNHLDLPAILWLQHYLTEEAEGQTIVIVSHDRNFLDSVTEETIIFRDKQLKYHPGNYDDWERNTEERRKWKQHLQDLEDKRRKQIMISIQKNVQMARSTGDDKRLGMVASRKKKLDRMGMQKMEDGKRFKVSYSAFGRDAISIEQAVRSAPIFIPEPELLKSHGSILQLSDVTFRYDSASPVILNNVSLDVGPHARIGFLGPNGCGKSTLMNILAGVLQPQAGEVKRHHLLRIGYFSQHTVDLLDLELTPSQQMKKMFPNASEKECRAQFGSVGIGSDVVQRSIRSLSGGQRSRVALALVTYDQPQVLLLDEITNHLDMGTVESLVESLCDFAGALVIVSHDVWFLRQVIEGSDSDSEKGSLGQDYLGVLYTVVGGQLRRWEKGLEAYVEKVERAARRRQEQATRSGSFMSAKMSDWQVIGADEKVSGVLRKPVVFTSPIAVECLVVVLIVVVVVVVAAAIVVVLDDVLSFSLSMLHSAA